MRPKGIMICIPAYGQSMTAQTAESLYSTGQWLTRQGIPNQLSWMSAADIVEVRNLFLTTWYDGHPEFSHLLFIDSDMGFHPMLIRDMIKFGKPLMGVLYARRQMPASVVGTVPEGHSIKDVVNGFMKANDLGCGVMMISRDVVKTILEKMPEVSDALPSVLSHAVPNKLLRLIRAFDPIRIGPRRLSEDVSFCHRYRECGGEIWANVDHKISHVGPFDYAIRYAGVLENKAKAAASEAA
jgi:hypothetical protein